MSSRNVLDIKKPAVRRADARRAPASSQQSKPLRLRTRRRRQRLIVACVCLLSALGLTGVLGAATHLEQLAVRDVSVSGALSTSAEEITESVKENIADDGFKLFSRKNMFLYPRSAIESALAMEYPRIKNVSVARESLIASAVVVSVEERKAFAAWCDETCYVMDSAGFIFAPEGDATETAYVFRGGLAPGEPIGQSFLRGRIQGIVALLSDLRNAGFAATGVTVDTEKDFTVTLESGLRLMLSFETPPTDIIRNLETALEAEGLREKLDSLEYIDLRFGNRVYYK